jgi:hypothetical protein
MISAQTVRDWGVDELWARVAQQVADGIVGKIDQSVGEAIKDLREVSVAYHHARCGFAMNRRLATPTGFRLSPNPNGMVDHDVPVLRITADSKIIGLVYGYACHNTALGPTLDIHGDYAGYASSRLEQEYPGCVAMYLAGCGGDQDPSPRRDLEDAKQNGLALASAVDAALSTAPVELPAVLSTQLEMVGLPFAPLASRDSLQTQAASGNGFVARHAQRILAKWPNAMDEPADYQYPVQVCVIGEKLTLVLSVENPLPSTRCESNPEFWARVTLCGWPGIPISQTLIFRVVGYCEKGAMRAPKRSFIKVFQRRFANRSRIRSWPLSSVWQLDSAEAYNHVIFPSRSDLFQLEVRPQAQIDLMLHFW